MDPEMIEYYKKIEEQKRRRDEFLLEKETRRKLLAMEKIGIKKEPFLGTFFFFFNIFHTFFELLN